MNIEDKTKRLNQLKKIDYPSDQEFQEIEQLEEELKEITSESFKETKIELGPGKGFVVPIPPQKKKSILKTILRINPPKPVTQTEIDQLKLLAQKEELKSRIAKAKGSRPNIIERVLGKSTSNPFDASSRKKGDYDPFRW